MDGAPVVPGAEERVAFKGDLECVGEFLDEGAGFVGRVGVKEGEEGVEESGGGEGGVVVRGDEFAEVCEFFWIG